MGNNKKGKQISVYPTVKERKQMEKEADNLGMTLTYYVRWIHRFYMENKDK